MRPAVCSGIPSLVTAVVVASPFLTTTSMESNKAMKAFDLITSLNELRKVSNIISTLLGCEEPKMTIISFAEEEPLAIDNKKIIKDIQRGIDYRIYEIHKEIEYL